MSRHQSHALDNDLNGAWDGIVQFSTHLEPGHFIRYLDRNGEEYEVVDAQ